MVKRSREKEKKINFNQILSRLKAIENRISVIESYLKRIDETSTLTAEDQLFFGFVFSLLLFSITLPEFDVGTLFESFGVKIELTKGIITTKMGVVILLLFSGGVRYLTTFAKEESKRNGRRIISVAFLLGSFYLLIAELLIRGLANLLSEVYIFSIFLAPIALTVVAIAIGVFVETKWYRIYGYDEPYVSKIVAYLGLLIVVAYYLAIIVSIFVQISDAVALLLIVASGVIVFLISKFFDRIHRKRRARA